MSDYKTTGLRDHKTNDDAAARRGQWSVVPPRRSYGAAGSSRWSPRQGAPRRAVVPQLRDEGGFTLAELLVSMAVLVLLVLLFTQLINSAATVTILGHKRMDADSQARQVFDRMAVDFAQMLRRKDVDYYGKVVPSQQLNKNDQMAFYSAVPGYYPSGSTGTQQSPLSLAGYRVNSNSASPAYNRLERLGKGLVWNGVSTTNTPAVFLPLTISATWPAAVSSSLADPDGNYEVIGPDVFRFEYYYQLKDGHYWDAICKGANCTGTLATWNVAAIVVAIAVIDPRSRLLLTEPQIATLNGNSTILGSNFLIDYSQDFDQSGLLPDFWQQKVNTIIRNQSLPRQAVSGIRVYERFFTLNQ